jgi:hypothetical protein
MRLFILLFAIWVAGCAQLLQGQQQPVKQLKNNVYITTCGGAVETWASCNDKAQLTCQGSYLTINKIGNSTGTNRELTFECIK